MTCCSCFGFTVTFSIFTATFSAIILIVNFIFTQTKILNGSVQKGLARWLTLSALICLISHTLYIVYQLKKNYGKRLKPLSNAWALLYYTSHFEYLPFTLLTYHFSLAILLTSLYMFLTLSLCIVVHTTLPIVYRPDHSYSSYM